MNELSGNPYANSMTEYLDPRNSLEALATMTLAFEQRTTTLAILILANRGGDDVLEQAREIEARLGQEQP